MLARRDDVGVWYGVKLKRSAPAGGINLDAPSPGDVSSFDNHRGPKSLRETAVEISYENVLSGAEPLAPGLWVTRKAR